MKKIHFGVLTTKLMPSFNPNDVDRVYIGKPRLCMCGCSGDYFGDKATIFKVIKRMKARAGFDSDYNIEVTMPSQSTGHIFSMELKTRRYVIYLKK